MSKSEAVKIVARYADLLRKNRYPVTAVYLFGSAARDSMQGNSDIDVAVVSERLRDDEDRSLLQLWKARRLIDTRIEPHGFTPENFEDNNDPLVYEIKRTGILVE